MNSNFTHTNFKKAVYLTASNKLMLLSLVFLAGWNVVWGRTVNQYTFATSTGATALTSSAWTTNTATSLTCDDGYFTGTIPFTFVYEGTSYTSFSFNYNGVVKLGTTSIGNATSGLTGHGPIIAAGFNDVSAGYLTGSIGYISHGLTSATSPNRVFVIDFFIRNNLKCSAARNTQFQVRLYETSFRTEIAFITTSAATTGMWAATSSRIGLGVASSTNYLSVTGTYTASNSTQTATPNWPSNGIMYSFTPPACTNPSISLTSGSSPQTICPGDLITNMVYTYSGSATGASVTNLFAGLS